ncbi:hypothetical protein A1O3_06078 [Capronia epimyces CBS 606.96]|uniref:DNA 3'-5' helicase n=1 Tax=Capronia epimyces CBS 606.96 TaxID=1182542 RepID=W9XY05_9EURO|nr:uncharacterized protein A1O3_06078 [Capronia epimyces CBS 606.96]EXJ82265.1 hypothetical protein A1O3_06078 [Capronia epimyces CBS 606.96]
MIRIPGARIARGKGEGEGEYQDIVGNLGGHEVGGDDELNKILEHEDILPAAPRSRMAARLERTTQQHLDVKLGVRARRQIHIAMQQEAARGEAAAEEEDNNCALHNGHTPEVERHHYALRVDMLHGLDERAMTVFLRHSQQWHRFLGLYEASSTAGAHKRKAAPATTTTALDLAGTLRQLHGVARAKEEVAEGRVGTKKEEPDEEGERSGKKVARDEPVQTGAGTVVRMDTWARSIQQQQAVEELVYRRPRHALMVQLPTGTGKTVLMEVAALLAETKTTVVVVPYRSLRRDLVARLRQRGFDINNRESDRWRAVHLVVVVLETWNVNRAFKAFIDDLVTQNRLARIIYDEAHLLYHRGLQLLSRPWAESIELSCTGLDEAK